MLPTRRTICLFACGLIPLVAEGVYRIISGEEQFYWPAIGLTLFFNVSIVIAMIVDVFWTTNSMKWHIERKLPNRLSVGTNNPVVIIVENRGKYALRGQLRDTPPPTTTVTPDLVNLDIAPHVWVELTYDLIPTQRGRFSFGDLFVRYRGRLGLVWLQSEISADVETQVYPNLLDVRRYESLVRMTLVRMGGQHHKRLPGASKEFSHFRDYTIDDDYRHINWNATARRGKHITSVYESEHSQDILFCLDAGRLMATRVGKLSKLDHAINAILMLTHVSQRFHDNVGLLVFSHKVHLYLPPAKGVSQHRQFLQALYSIQPELCYVDYRSAFQHLVSRHPKRALTLIFTDLLDDMASQEYTEATKLLRRYHLPLTFAIADVPLLQLAQSTPKSIEAMYDVQTARDLVHSRTDLLRSLERQGSLVVDTIPEQLTIDAVNQYLALKTAGAK